MPNFDAVIARARMAAESRMSDACTIRRVTNTTTGAGGVITKVYSTLYTGPCRIHQVSTLARPHDVGEDFVLMLRLSLHLPVATSAGLRTEDEVTVTASPRDPDLVGRAFIVWELGHMSQASARRVGVQERT